MASIDSYPLVEVNFSQLKRELVVANPKLATMALEVFQRGIFTQSQWNLDINCIQPLQHRSGNTQPRTSDYFAQGENHIVASSPGHAMTPFTSFHQTHIRQPNGPLHIIPTANFRTFKNDLDTSFPSFAMVPTKPMYAPEDFQFFKKLPLELQMEVWKLAVNKIPARVISLRSDKADIPGVIQACQASRLESKKKFRFCVSRADGE